MTALPNIRCWRRYSLRALLGVITIFGIWFGIATDRATKQKRAVEMLRAKEAIVYYHHQLTPKGYDPAIEPWAPRWLRSWVGEDYFATVAEVSLYPAEKGSPDRKIPHFTPDDLALIGKLYWLGTLRLPEVIVSDSDLVAWQRLSKLKELHVNGVTLTDTGLAMLGSFKQLTELDLVRPTTANEQALPNKSITDAGLEHLAGLGELQQLSLCAVGVSDAALPHLARLKRLRSLSLWHCAVSDQGLVTLGKLPSLTRLFLNHTQVTDEGLKTLSTLQGLEIITLNDTAISDRGLCYLGTLPLLTHLMIKRTAVDGSGLKGFRALEYLWLDETQVDDAALANLVDMPSLCILVLDGTRVTDTGLDHLAPLKRLYAVGLSRTTITDQGLAKLVESNKAIWDLGIEHTQVTDAALVPLRKLPLSFLYAEGSGISESAAEQFRQATGAKVFTAANPESAQ